MALDATLENIHAAAMIRLQTAYTALQAAAPALQRAALDHADEGASEALRLVRAAMRVVIGQQTEIPDELRRSAILYDAARTARFLEIPTGY